MSLPLAFEGAPRAVPGGLQPPVHGLLAAGGGSLADNGPLAIAVGAVICLGGIAFLADLGGIASRWNASRAGRPAAATPELQRRQDQLLRWRHWLTIALGAVLVIFGLAHL